MTTNKEILIERERCKKVVENKITRLVKYREENIKRKYRRNICMIERLGADIIFLINNPHYVRKTEDKD